MSILIKGGEVDLVDVKGNTIVLPSGYGLCHDESGKKLPRCSLFIGPVLVSKERVEKLPPDAARYFGDDYEGLKARIDIPSGQWKSVAEIREIVYFRPGEFADDWQHEFKPPVPLLKQGRWYQLKLPSGCKVTWRGIEKP